MKRKDFLKTIAAIGSISLVPSSKTSATTSTIKTNIIYILADDLGYGDLGCYGQKEIKTPCIDKMASEGLKFTDHYSGSTVCAPSRSTLITGLHTGHTQIRNNKARKSEGNYPLLEGCQTIGGLLQKVGYKTGMIGKWGLGYPGSIGDPNKQGFDYFYGYNCQREAHNYYPDHLWHNDKKEILKGNLNGKQTEYTHDMFANDALNFIRKNKNNPFFLYLPFTIPHTKFQIPDLGIYKDKNWSKSQLIQAAMITRMDKDVGRILALLKELKLDKNTIVIFASDNGAHGEGGTLKKFKASGKLHGYKRSLYDGGLRVPMIVRWPEKVKPNTTSKHISAFWDILPTVAEIAGAKVTKPTDGISMIPTFLNKGVQRKHEFLYWEFGKKVAVRMNRWKLVGSIGSKKSNYQLFDLEVDISEKNNISKKNPDIMKKMIAILKKAHTPSKLFPLPTE